MWLVYRIVPDNPVQVAEPVGEPGAQFAVLVRMAVIGDAPAVHIGLRFLADERFRLVQAVQQSFQDGDMVVGPFRLQEFHEFGNAEQAAEEVRRRTAVRAGAVIRVGPENQGLVTFEIGVPPAPGMVILECIFSTKLF